MAIYGNKAIYGKIGSILKNVHIRKIAIYGKMDLYSKISIYGNKAIYGKIRPIFKKWPSKQKKWLMK